MKPQSSIGIVLIIVGLLILIYQGFTYTKKTNIVDVGPLKVNAEKKETVPISPIVGGLCLAGGVVVVVMSGRS